MKADRIIRKELKEKTEKPLVPLSSFDPLAHSNNSSTTASASMTTLLSNKSSRGSSTLLEEKDAKASSCIQEIVEEQPKEQPRRLIQVIGEEESEQEETKEETKEKKNVLEPSIPTSSPLLIIQPTTTTTTTTTTATTRTTTPQSSSSSSSSSSSEIPTLSSNPESLAAMMQRRSSNLRISHEEDEAHCKLTSEEKELLLSIKNIAITVHPDRMHAALFSLVDILCAYCYDVRMTQHDPTPESAWTISILSPTLSWLVPSTSLRHTLIGFVRRVLVYPYLRRYDLARLCIKDCIVILKLGTRRLLKCLLEVGLQENNRCIKLIIKRSL